MANVKISELTAASVSDIIPDRDFLIINDGAITKKIDARTFLAAAGTDISGSLIPLTTPGALTSSFDLGSPTAAWGEIYVATSSLNFVESDGTITKWSKQDVLDLREGKSIATDKQSAIKHPKDSSTFVKMKSNAPGRVDHIVSNISLLSLQTSSFGIGDPNTPSVPITMSGDIIVRTSNQSFDVETGTGGFNVNNLLDLLANYGQTGIPTGSGEGGGVAAGDINLDGQVNVNDLLLVLAGYGNPNQVCTDQIIPPNVNHQFIGPTISVCEGNTLSISTGSFCSITF